MSPAQQSGIAQEQAEQVPAAGEPEADNNSAEKTPVQRLLYWETVRGGNNGFGDSMLGGFADRLTGTNYVMLRRPLAVAVRGDFLYIVDGDLDQVLRYDRITGAMEPIRELKGITAGDVEAIFVAPDYSYYLADTFGARVLKFDADNDLERVYESPLNLSHPVAVVEDPQTRDVLVADAQFDHVLVFKQGGDLVKAIGGRGEEPGKFLNITTMALGPDGFYIGARVGPKVQVLSPEGIYLYSLEPGTVRFPFAMATDEDGRVFIADYMDNSIKVYERGTLVASIGSTGVGPGQFKRIAGLAVNQGFLYVADSLNGRIQVMRITNQPIELPSGHVIMTPGVARTTGPTPGDPPDAPMPGAGAGEDASAMPEPSPEPAVEPVPGQTPEPPVPVDSGEVPPP